MNKKLTTSELSVKLGKFALIAIVLCAMFAISMAPAIAPAFAETISTAGMDKVMDIVVDIIGKAALYIGIVICLWGVFQIVLAFRREDSEGISKQITTVIVGGVLVTFGALADSLYQTLMSEGQ